MNRKRINVLVVDDSIFFRKVLVDNLSKFDDIEIVGYAVNAFDAEKKVEQLRPDVVTLDVEMPGMTGIDFLKKLLPKYPVPVILVSSLSLKLFDALSAGAVDFVRKPDPSAGGVQEFIKTLHNKIVIGKISRVHVPAAPESAPPMRQPARGPMSSGTSVSGTSTTSSGGSSTASSVLMPKIPSYKLESFLIAIGASTGGTEAILAVLRKLPAECPPIVITQHMPAGFTKMYAERLNRICAMEVREAQDGDQLHKGLALIAPGGLQMSVSKKGSSYTAHCYAGGKVNGLCPAVDVLFDSVADHVTLKTVGVILTGMGRDGADGLLHMRNKGAYTIGQDKESCVVYGMPMAAFDDGAVCTQAPLDKIPNILMNYIAKQP